MAGLLNRAKMSTSTTGTGTVTLGSAVTGFLSFAEAGAVNATVYPYVIEDGDDFEIGIGTYTSSGTTFSRDTVTASKISGTAGTSKINLSGSATIFLTARAGDILNPANNLSDVAAAATAASNLGLGTGDSPQFTGINVGHATDTTVTRSGAGHIAVEGVDVVLETEVREVLTASRTYYVRANLGTVTMTIASPAVATLTSHGLSADDPIVFSTSGALPTGVTAGTTYYVLSTDLTTDTFKFSTSAGGAAVNTSGSQSGTHKLATGNNSNNGLAQTRAGALLTVQKAVDLVASIDLAAYSATIQLAVSTYDAGAVLKSYIGAGPVYIIGDETTPSNVLISVTSSSETGIFLSDAVVGAYYLSGMKLTSTVSGQSAIRVYNNSVVKYSLMDFGALSGSGAHILVSDLANVTALGSYTISGGAAYHWNLLMNASLRMATTLTITITGTPAFSTAFVKASRGAVAYLGGITFTGSATGVRFTAEYGGTLYTNGSSPSSYFPGDAAGSGTNYGASPYGMYQ